MGISLEVSPKPQDEPSSSSSFFSRFQNLYETCLEKQADGESEQKWLREIENQCKLALQHFQMCSKLVKSFLTPNAAILKFQGDRSITVEQVRKRQSEFLSTHGVNILSVKAEPGLISLTIARPTRPNPNDFVTSRKQNLKKQL